MTQHSKSLNPELLRLLEARLAARRAGVRAVS